MISRRSFLLLTAGTSVLLAIGCSRDTGNRPKVVPVRGVVLFNGQALAGAHVTFTNAQLQLSSYARTDADGKFALTTFEPGDGAAPGPQTVSVSKVQVVTHVDPNVDRTTMLPREKLKEPERRWLIPERYGSMATSGLTAEVSERGKNDVVLELSGNAGESETPQRGKSRSNR